MSIQIIPVDPFDCVVFGGTGDLAERKLLPALYHRQIAQQFSEPTRIIGASRAVMTHEEYRDFAKAALKEHLKDDEWDEDEIAKFMARLYYVSVDAKSADGWANLKDLLEEGKDRIRAFYLAVSPALFGDISERIRDHKLITRQTRIVVEKPIGRDLASALDLNNTIGKVFKEEQIYRIDHYLGKETVQNLMVLRFGNSIFEPLWRSPYIKSVQITVAESVGVGSRAGFYDGTGAMRDMIQNHLLQLLCIVAMEPPVSLDPDAVRDEKLKVLRSLRPMTVADVAKDTVRGQYTAGASNGEAAVGYLQEANIPEGSTTETFVALKAHINNWRWANVPIFLRTGKRMAARQSEIVIEFADLPFTIFSDSAHRSVNRLMIRLQPEEHIQLQMMAKEPGSGMKLRPVSLNLDLESAFTERRAEAYERLLIDVTKGRLTHFMRRDELEAAWAWVEPIIDGWQQLGEKPKAYTAGSWGPAASSALMAREGSAWVEEA